MAVLLLLVLIIICVSWRLIRPRGKVVHEPRESIGHPMDTRAATSQHGASNEDISQPQHELEEARMHWKRSLNRSIKLARFGKFTPYRGMPVRLILAEMSRKIRNWDSPIPIKLIKKLQSSVKEAKKQIECTMQRQPGQRADKNIVLLLINRDFCCSSITLKQLKASLQQPDLEVVCQVDGL
jgi:hypothetical protein